MRTIGVVLSTTLMLTACDEPASQQTVAEKEAAQVAAARTLTGWNRVFALPVETVGSINQAGFGLPDYAATSGGVHLSQGVDRLMSRSAAPSPNMGTASVSGSTPGRIDQISYVLKLNDPADAATARDRLAQSIGEFLTRADIAGGDPLLAAIREGRTAQVPVGGLPANVTATANRIDVTFLRPAATAAPANS